MKKLELYQPNCLCIDQSRAEIFREPFAFLLIFANIWGDLFSVCYPFLAAETGHTETTSNRQM
jgi:hypothetical protein